MDPLVRHPHVQTCFLGVFLFSLSEQLAASFTDSPLFPFEATQRSLSVKTHKHKRITFSPSQRSRATPSYTELAIRHGFKSTATRDAAGKRGQKNLFPRRRDRGGIFRFKRFDSTSHRDP